MPKSVSVTQLFALKKRENLIVKVSQVSFIINLFSEDMNRHFKNKVPISMNNVNILVPDLIQCVPFVVINF